MCVCVCLCSFAESIWLLFGSKTFPIQWLIEPTLFPPDFHLFALLYRMNLKYYWLARAKRDFCVIATESSNQCEKFMSFVWHSSNTNLYANFRYHSFILHVHSLTHLAEFADWQYEIRLLFHCRAPIVVTYLIRCIRTPRCVFGGLYCRSKNKEAPIHPHCVQNVCVCVTANANPPVCSLHKTKLLFCDPFMGVFGYVANKNETWNLVLCLNFIYYS